MLKIIIQIIILQEVINGWTGQMMFQVRFGLTSTSKENQITETALKQIIKQAELAGWTLEQALTESITRGWQSFKAEWVNKQGYNQQS